MDKEDPLVLIITPKTIFSVLWTHHWILKDDFLFYFSMPTDPFQKWVYYWKVNLLQECIT